MPAPLPRAKTWQTRSRRFPVEQVCILYQNGLTVRELAKQYNVSQNAIHKEILKRLGKGVKAKDKGMIAILNEHLAQIPESKRDEVRRWMTANQAEIANSKGLLSAQAENSLSQRETWGGGCDFRLIASTVWRCGDVS